MNWSRNSKLLDRYLSPFAVQFCVSIIIGAVLNWILNLLVKMLRDAENAKFGLKTEAKASSSKENEVMVSCYPGTLNLLWCISGLPTSSQELKLTSLWSNAKLLYMHGQEVGERLVLLFLLLRECSVWPFCMSSPRFHLPVAHRRQQDKKCKNHYIVAYECGLPTGWP